jgi:predicted transcriptional regulator
MKHSEVDIMNQSSDDHITRKRIFKHITEYPGVSFSVIKHAFGLKDGTLRYHLNYLEKKQEIKSTREGKNRLYYPIQTVIFNQQAGSHFELYKLSDEQEKIIKTIQFNPGITQKELKLRTGIKRVTLSYNINKLLGFGIIQKRRDGRNIHYSYITDEELRKKIIRQLIIKFVNHEIDEQLFITLKRKLEI